MAREARFSDIPVIDIGDIKFGRTEAPKPEDYRRIGDQLSKAFCDLGVVFVSNHGIPEDQINEALKVVVDFFALPKATKTKYIRTREDFDGYTRSLSKTNRQDLSPDIHESLRFMHGGRKWPDDEAPKLSKDLGNLSCSCGQVSKEILKCLSLSLGLDADFFHKYHTFSTEKNTSVLRINHYPPVSLDDQITRLRAHTDEGTLTMLFHADDVGGFEIKNRQGEWEEVRPIPGTFLLLVADLLQRWIGDIWVAPLHRVDFPSNEAKERRRLSTVFFVNPDHHVKLTSVCGPNKYEINDCDEYMLEKLA